MRGGVKNDPLGVYFCTGPREHLRVSLSSILKSSIPHISGEMKHA